MNAPKLYLTLQSTLTVFKSKPTLKLCHKQLSIKKKLNYRNSR